ncbi:zinc finger, C3HC4 type [Oesophagostomum dentatum]|uniref:Zinc finger, C3HC4 type n=1 Tax=Oesophagostomum dentatum TaxID=61180 RepID=A0A0B1SDF7_OESDE|nr:zinc finger, C3HC4 type [Oesophagostomum dentatum]
MPVACRICLEPFSAVSATANPPRLLGCGHSFCSTCTDSLYAVSGYLVQCPVCRSRLSSRVVPPVNFQLLGLPFSSKGSSKFIFHRLA